MKNYKTTRPWLLSLLLLFSGCQSAPSIAEKEALRESGKTNTVMEAVSTPDQQDESADQSSEADDTGEEGAPAQAPLADDGQSGSGLAISKPNDLPSMMIDEFSVNKGVRLGVVLRALARIADINIVFGDAVENRGPFRFRLNNPTPWNEVFESILGVNHLTYEVHGEMITVMTLQDMNQRYQLEKQKSDQLDLMLRQEAMTPLDVEVIPISYVKAEDLVEPLTKILQQNAREENGELRGSVSADKTSNNLVLQASKADLEKMSGLVKRMDRKTRQVRIEATLVEVSSDFAYDMGVQWSLHGNGSITAPDTRNGGALSPMQMDNEGEFTLSDATYETMQGLINTSDGTIDYGIISSDFALGMNLQALEQDGKIKILSSPSLTTMENKQAVIKSGTDIPFRSTDRNNNPVVEYKEAVLSLEVQPQIIDDAAIFMNVKITKDEPDFSQVVDGNPVVLKKFIESRMMVLDGQTAVIGGLTKNSTFDRNSGLPFLRHIPLIGRLFSSESVQDSKEELMIFLTPRVIPNHALDNSRLAEEWMSRVGWRKDEEWRDAGSEGFQENPAATMEQTADE